MCLNSAAGCDDATPEPQWERSHCHLSSSTRQVAQPELSINEAHYDQGMMGELCPTVRITAAE